MEVFDVIIVGGGPAGLKCAWELSASSLRVLLLEKQQGFGDTFLVGEAAGLASGLTGEGIYQSLVSGMEVARMIMNPEHESVELDQVLKYNRAMDRVMATFRRAGPLLGALQELLLILMNTAWIRNKVRDQFSSIS